MFLVNIFVHLLFFATRIQKKILFVGACPDPTPENAYIRSTSHTPVNGRYPSSTSVAIRCNSGYVYADHVSGHTSTICNMGKWYPPLVKCVPIEEGECIQELSVSKIVHVDILQGRMQNFS